MQWIRAIRSSESPIAVLNNIGHRCPLRYPIRLNVYAWISSIHLCQLVWSRKPSSIYSTNVPYWKDNDRLWMNLRMTLNACDSWNQCRKIASSIVWSFVLRLFAVYPRTIISVLSLICGSMWFKNFGHIGRPANSCRDWNQVHRIYPIRNSTRTCKCWTAASNIVSDIRMKRRRRHQWTLLLKSRKMAMAISSTNAHWISPRHRKQVWQIFNPTVVSNLVGIWNCSVAMNFSTFPSRK